MRQLHLDNWAHNLPKVPYPPNPPPTPQAAQPPFLHLYAKSEPLGSLSFSLIFSHLFLINFLLSRGSYFNTPTSYFILSKTVWGYQLFNGEGAEEYVNID